MILFSMLIICYQKIWNYKTSRFFDLSCYSFIINIILHLVQLFFFNYSPRTSLRLSFPAFIPLSWYSSSFPSYKMLFLLLFLISVFHSYYKSLVAPMTLPDSKIIIFCLHRKRSLFSFKNVEHILLLNCSLRLI